MATQDKQKLQAVLFRLNAVGAEIDELNKVLAELNQPGIDSVSDIALIHGFLTKKIKGE